MEPDMKLRTIEDLASAHEWLINKQRKGEIDSKAADGMNTTLKGATYLMGKLKMDYAKLWVQAQIKKIQIPVGVLPDVNIPTQPPQP